MATSRRPQNTAADKQATEDFARDLERSKQTADQLDSRFTAMQSTVRALGIELKDGFYEQVKNANKEWKDLGKSLDNALKSNIKETEKFAKTLNKNQKSLASAAQIEAQVLEVQRRKESLAELLVEASAKGFALTQKQRDAAHELLVTMETQLYVLEKQKERSEKMLKTLGVYGRLMKGLTKIPIVGQLIDANRVLEKMKKTAEEGGGKLKVLGVGIAETFKSIGASLTDPGFLLGGLFTILTSIVKLVLEFENKTFEIAKNLGVGVTEAGKMRSEFIQMAAASNNLGLRTSEIVKAYGEMNDQMGFLTPRTVEFTEAAAKLQKNIGASAEQMSALATFGALSGKSLQKAYTTAVASAKMAGVRNKLAVSERQILEGIAKTSSAVLVNFKGNLPALTEAIVRAKKLGTTLDQINKQGSSLLDFESSIAAQFEAEVLTGKTFNLQKARELALAGKTVELGEELTRQGVTLAEYEGMNTLAKEATAKMIGLSTEELSKQLILQKQAAAIGAKEGESLQQRYGVLMKTVEGRKLLQAQLDKQTLSDLAASSAADQMAKTWENIKEQLAEMLVDTIIPMVKNVMAWLKSSVNIQKVADTIKGTFNVIQKVINNLPTILATVAGLLTAMATISIANAVAAVVGSTALIPGIGLVAAGIAGAGMYTYLKGLLSGGGGGGAPSSIAPSAAAAPISSGGGGSIAPASAAYTPPAENTTAGGRSSSSTSGADITANLVVDGHVLASTMVKYLPQNAGANGDSRTSKT